MTATSITIIIWNRTSVTLSNFVGVAKSGSTPVPAGTTTSGGSFHVDVPPNASLQVVAKNGNGGCFGTINLSDAETTVSFPIRYAVPNDGKKPAVVWVEPETSFPSCMSMSDQEAYKSLNPEASISLYVGLAVTEWNDKAEPYIAGYAVPLSKTPYAQNNAKDVVNSMFHPKIRKPDALGHWFKQGAAMPYLPADYSGNQLVKTTKGPAPPLVEIMASLWPYVGDNPDMSSPDYPLIAFLANFLVPSVVSPQTPPLVMYVPQISYQNYVNSGGVTGPKYLLSGYQAYPFAGTGGKRFNESTVRVFLQLLLGGAHFVNIQADNDFKALNPKSANTGRDLYVAFQNQFADNNTMTGRHNCIGNSHYTTTLGPVPVTVNKSGWYYGSQMGAWASDNCGLLLALLVAKTADSQYDTFMQLEGWPADGDWWSTGSLWGGARHGQDFKAYQASLWNISTFGATPYSEKRATTIFLAPKPWVPNIYSDTYMMPYVGAGTRQSWLQTALVSVPSGTPAHP